MSEVLFSAKAMGHILSAVAIPVANGDIKDIPNTDVKMGETVAVAMTSRNHPNGSFTAIVWTFTAEEEEQSVRRHFELVCGWDPQEVKKLTRRKHAWFCARVDAVLIRYESSLEVSTEHLGTDYLGACLYDSITDFVVRYRRDYLLDMMHECLPDVDTLESRRRLTVYDVNIVADADAALTERKRERYITMTDIPTNMKTKEVSHE